MEQNWRWSLQGKRSTTVCGISENWKVGFIQLKYYVANIVYLSIDEIHVN